ncbi:MAG: Uma2 family endonuclease [Candidatus Eremiobacterota bacterium]
MSDPLQDFLPDLEPDISHLDLDPEREPLNLFSEREHRLLVQPLYNAWNPGRPFVAMSDVGLFPEPKQTPYIPDMLLSLDVSLPEDMTQKRNLAYFVWVYGKPPDLVVEVVSNRDGHEEQKIEGYARLGIAYYIIFDPFRYLSTRELRAYELHGRSYLEMLKPVWIEHLQLGATLWDGEYEGATARWLRWCDREGRVLPTGLESAREARLQAEQERQRAERLAARLRELGLAED